MADAERSFGIFVFSPLFLLFETRFCECGMSFIDTHNWENFPTLTTGATTKGSRPVSDNPDGPRLSWYKPNSVSAFAQWRSFVSLGFLSARHRDAGCDYYPRVFPGFPGKRAGNSSLCFVLHHMGFFVRLRLRERPVGSYPAFSPLPGASGAGRYIFCDTVRHPEFTFQAPPFSRGMLPSGVRTFLWQNRCQASDHPPRSTK